MATLKYVVVSPSATKGKVVQYPYEEISTVRVGSTGKSTSEDDIVSAVMASIQSDRDVSLIDDDKHQERIDEKYDFETIDQKCKVEMHPETSSVRNEVDKLNNYYMELESKVVYLYLLFTGTNALLMIFLGLNAIT